MFLISRELMGWDREYVKELLKLCDGKVFINQTPTEWFKRSCGQRGIKIIDKRLVDSELDVLNK